MFLQISARSKILIKCFFDQLKLFWEFEFFASYDFEDCHFLLKENVEGFMKRIIAAISAVLVVVGIFFGFRVADKPAAGKDKTTVTSQELKPFSKYKKNGHLYNW